MKHYLMSAGAIVAVIILCLYSTFRLRSAAERTYTLVEQSRQGALEERWEPTMDLSVQAASLWREEHDPLAVILHHQELDDILEDLNRLCSFALLEDQSEFCGCAEEILTRLQNLIESEMPNYWNIL